MSGARKRRDGDSGSSGRVGVPASPKARNKAEPLTTADLGWSRKKAAEIRASLLAFEEDWNAPGMEAYDKL